MGETARENEITVSMIHPKVWEREVLEITDPIPVFEWIEKSTRPGDRIVKLPEDTLITSGRYAGGQVIAVYMGAHLFAVPPEAIPSLEGLYAG